MPNFVRNVGIIIFCDLFYFSTVEFVGFAVIIIKEKTEALQEIKNIFPATHSNSSKQNPINTPDFILFFQYQKCIMSSLFVEFRSNYSCMLFVVFFLFHVPRIYRIQAIIALYKTVSLPLIRFPHLVPASIHTYLPINMTSENCNFWFDSVSYISCLIYRQVQIAMYRVGRLIGRRQFIRNMFLLDGERDGNGRIIKIL